MISSRIEIKRKDYYVNVKQHSTKSAWHCFKVKNINDIYKASE